MSLLTGLVEYWKFEESSGNRVGVTGTALAPAGSPLPGNATGKFGNAVALVAANSQYLDGGNLPQFSPGASSFTLALWGFMSSLPNNNGFLVGKFGSSSPYREYRIALSGSSGTILFDVRNQDGTSTSISQVVPATGGFFSVIAWFDFANQQIGLSVQGQTPTIAAISATSVFQGTGSFTVGAENAVGAASDPRFFWDGRVDALGYWSRVLTAAEQTQWFNNGAGLAHPFPSRAPASARVVSAVTRTITTARTAAAISRTQSRYPIDSYRPRQVGGLVLRLSAEQKVYQDSARTTVAAADGDPVGWWGDVTTLTQRSFSQATAGKRAALTLNQANGKPCVRFASASSQELTNASVPELQILNDKTIVAVVRPISIGATSPFLGNLSANYYLGIYPSVGQYGVRMSWANSSNAQVLNSSSVGIVALNQVQVFVSRLTVSGVNVTGALRLNGASVGNLVSSAGASATVSANWAIGSLRSSNFLDGDIFELNVYNRSLSDSEIAGLEAYLLRYYGIV